VILLNENLPGGLSDEQLLIAYSSRVVLTDREKSIVERLLRQDLDWDEVLTLSRRHLVTPLMYNALSASSLLEYVPQGIREKMHRNTTGNLARNMQKRAELLRVLSALEDKGVKTVVLKGNALVHTIYGDESLRVFGDIDLLVPRGRLEAAKTVMAEMGYSTIAGVYPVPDDQNEELGCEWTYVGPAGIIVEIHWDLLDRKSSFAIAPQELIDRSEAFDLDGREAYSLSTEDLLIHLCIHQFKHHWEQLRDLCDVNEIIRQGEVDWDVLLSRSALTGADRCVYYTLRLAGEFLETPVPDNVFRTFESRVRPGVVSRSVFDLVKRSVLAHEAPHGFWPVILVEGSGKKLSVIYETLLLQSRSAAAPEAGESGPPQRRSPMKVITESVRSVVGYRHLVYQLVSSLLRNLASSRNKRT